MRYHWSLPPSSRVSLDVWNLIPGEGSAEVVKNLVKDKIQVRSANRSRSSCPFMMAGIFTHMSVESFENMWPKQGCQRGVRVCEK